MRFALRAAAVTALILMAGCDNDSAPSSAGGPRPGALADGSVPAVPTRVPIGRGPLLRPGAGPGPSGRVTARLPCRAARRGRALEQVHVELFAAGRTVIVPAGVGVAPPRTRRGAFVTGGRCVTALRTTEPTGVIELIRGTQATLGDLFAVWGRTLTPERLLGFSGPVRAWVDGRRWAGPVRRIPLRDRSQIVLVSGPDVPVHATYAFPPRGVTRLRP